MFQRYYRKVIKIKATDSPNVRLGLAQQASGLEPTDEVIVPGVLRYGDYLKRRKMWDKVRQCVGLDAEFYEGAELLLYPPEWLNAAEQYHATRPKHDPLRDETWMGVDPGEGAEETAWVVIDRHGVLCVVAFTTPDTSVIAGRTRKLMREWKVRPENVLFDRGGGGKQAADTLRSQGWEVRTVGFGDGVAEELEERSVGRKRRHDLSEQRYAFRNRRAQMFGEFSMLLDPARLNAESAVRLPGDAELPLNRHPFALPPDDAELRRQLAPIPKTYDGEGRQYLIPKNKQSETYKGPTLTDLIGCSPNRADALVLATHGMLRPEAPDGFVIAGPAPSSPRPQGFDIDGQFTWRKM